jgi:hypothetical protein
MTVDVASGVRVVTTLPMPQESLMLVILLQSLTAESVDIVMDVCMLSIPP